MPYPLFLAFFVSAMAVVVTRWSELAKLVTDHVFIHRNRDELHAVVNAEGQANKVRKNSRTTRPGLDRRTSACFPAQSALFSAGGGQQTDLF